jgi:hypothetical protein
VRYFVNRIQTTRGTDEAQALVNVWHRNAISSRYGDTPLYMGSTKEFDGGRSALIDVDKEEKQMVSTTSSNSDTLPFTNLH